MSSVDDDPLAQYKLQLLSVEESLTNATSDNKTDLLDLKAKLTEVISLLQGSQPESCEEYSVATASTSKEEDVDDEFLRFQKEINELEGTVDPEEDNEDAVDDAVHEEFCSVLDSMEGNKCRAPFMREWGEKGFHNALIFSTDLEGQDIQDPQEVKVKVMFCNPTCDQMRPCPFFLDGHCKFSDDKCRFSHGYSVKFSELEEYILPDYSSVQRDSRCMAKYKDGLWYSAVVENCLGDQKFLVKYANSKDSDTLPAQDILPLGDVALSDEDSSDNSSEDSNFMPETSISSQPQKEINYKAVTATSPIGSWEQHTKGIGSKLMAKMGYVWGQGLGKHSDGRLDPVEAIVLPKGKSLDKCVEIREMSGLDSVEDRFSSEQKKEQRRAENIEKNSQPPETSVFAFLNKNLSKSNGTFQNGESSKKRPLANNETCISQSADLNFEMYSVGEAIKNTRKEISRLQQSVKRNADRNEAACSLMKQKLSTKTNLLRTLQAKEQRISNEINRKKNHKKIAVF
ncbi:hypothetical protein JTE90_028566 [Oedothorax gibbosus]|uniref:Zinc finger CCCH-type with G patch domain-containing protein n=1 Tax=Oedothorax gibbosus TaxID=931172 RepID=A0AAV6VXD9_9ARAC|nr:hypothetical protein JTE90_028566 [Oedothorax gibbosus]